MSKKPQQSAYIYASARVRSLENTLIGKDRVAQLADAANMDELYARLEEYGVALVRDQKGSVLVEPSLQGILTKTLEQLLEAAPAPEVYDFMRYPYDCHNVKAAIKCHLRKLPCENMLLALGVADVAQVAKMPETGEFAALPPHMAKAAPAAMQAYAKTANPRAIDLALDKACFADMLAAAKDSGEEFHVQLVRAQIDLVNLMMCLRLVRMQSGEQGAMLLDSAWLEGGTLEKATLLRAYPEGEQALLACLNRTAYEKVAKWIAESDGSAAAAERAADDYRMELLRAAKQTTFGAAVLTAYFYAQEYAVKNIRIVIASKQAGLSAEIIHERIRTSYV